MTTNEPFSREQILAGLILDIAESLAIEPEDVSRDAFFFSGLGGESIELLDLSFRIQKRFGIRTRFQELFEGWEFDANGRRSAATEQKLSAAFPQIDWSNRIAAMSGDDPRDVLTVDLIAELLFYSQTTNDERTDASVPVEVTSNPGN